MRQVLAVTLFAILSASCRTPSSSGSGTLDTPSHPIDPDDSGGPEEPLATFDKDFFFGIATAPAHVEDQLDDVWLEFARDTQKKGVKAWHNAGHPELRLNFWTDYKTEIDLARKLGVKVFRMGIDWGRLVPKQPENTCPGQADPCYEGIQDQAALAHYKQIIAYVRSQGMSVMMTLFHHSPPRWLNDLKVDHKGKRNSGGWTNAAAPYMFEAFSRDAVQALKGDVDIWVIFNEPAVFASLAYGAGIWPPAEGMNYMAMFKTKWFEGKVFKAFNLMVDAHKRVYRMIKALDTEESGDPLTAKTGPAYVGVAHNVSYQTARSVVGQGIANYLRSTLNYKFIDDIIDSLDFLGLNYYGEEVVSLNGVPPVPDKEYSESGRAVNPQGFYITLMQFHARYLQQRRIPIIITENGISDGTDKLRPAYLVEHLLAIDAARAKGVPIVGYVFWTLSDNWEWADGYCPKFGLVAVDRDMPALRRTPRPSFDLYHDIATSGRITPLQRDDAWEQVRGNYGKKRLFCRSADGKNSLDRPADRLIVESDWRFTVPETVPPP
jgi:beta-glucosidase/6-phospho-beta-glucosidase/beta-galactosidase